MQPSKSCIAHNPRHYAAAQTGSTALQPTLANGQYGPSFARPSNVSKEMDATTQSPV